MPKKNTYPKKIVLNYLKQVAQKIEVEKGFLFGSYARGEADKHSDVDLIVVSPQFRKMGFMKRLHFLSHMRENGARAIAMEIIGYTPEEFEEMEQHSPNLAKIKREGKVIFPIQTPNLK